VDRSGFVDWVRDTVRRDDADAAVEALLTARRIRVVSEIEPLALSIVRDSLNGRGSPPARLVATAVACIGELRAGRAVGVLAECLSRHPDPRVRANAAEAMGRCRRAAPCEDAMEQGLLDGHHRVRASAVRSLLAGAVEPKSGGGRLDDRLETLACMLHDNRSSHRLAGVWVVQRSLCAGMRGMIGARWGELTAHVRWLAADDEDQSVRSRAAAVAGRLDAAVAGLGPRSAGGLAS
jgi:HEAT repeat protein